MKVFNKYLAFIFISIFIGNSTFCQTIIYNNLALANSKVKLARHYGEQILLEREVNANEYGKSVFYFDSLHSGIYYLVFPDSSSYEFLFDRDYPGKIVLATNRGSLIDVQKAPTPTLMYSQYLEILENITIELDSINYTLRQHNISNREIKKVSNRKKYLLLKKDSLLTRTSEDFAGTFLGEYLKAKMKITVPDYNPPKDIHNKDSAIWAWQLQYFNKHFLDNVNLADGRLIHTPIYTSMVNRYLDNITRQDTADLKKAIDYMLSIAKKSYTTKVFLTDYLLKKFNSLKNNSVYEVVYVHIIYHYYLSETSPWMSHRDLSILTNEYNQRYPVLIGKQAPDITMQDETRVSKRLHDIDSRYVVLYFHTYDCSLCSKTSPYLKKLTNRYDSTFLTTYAVCVGEKDNMCAHYIKKNNLGLWVNVFEATESGKVASAYNLKYTPTIYLLDRNKTILSKNLNIEQLEELLNDDSTF